MRTELEKLTDADLSDERKAIRRVEEAGVIRTPEASSKIATARLRTAVAELTDTNFQDIQVWLDRVSTTDPAKALDFVLRLLEFSVPKLSRVEATIKDAGKSGVGDLTIGELQAMLVTARTIDGELQSADDAEDADFSDII